MLKSNVGIAFPDGFSMSDGRAIRIAGGSDSITASLHSLRIGILESSAITWLTTLSQSIE